MTEHRAHPHRSVDHFVFLITCGFVVPPFVAWLVMSGRTDQENAFAIFAPFVAATVLVVLLVLIELIERVVAGSRPGWPLALLGIPVATIASGFSFAVVDPSHHWWRDGLADTAWSVAAATWGWRRWQTRFQAAEGGGAGRRCVCGGDKKRAVMPSGTWQ